MGFFGILFLVLIIIPLFIVAIPVIFSFLIGRNFRIVRHFERKEERGEERRRKQREKRKGKVYISKYPEQKQILNTEGVGKYVSYEEVKEEENR